VPVSSGASLQTSSRLPKHGQWVGWHAGALQVHV